MSFFKKFIRYKFSSICIICLFTLAYLAFYYGAYENIKMDNETKDKNRFSYPNSAMEMVSSDLGVSGLEQIFDLSVESSYISIVDFPMYVDSMLATVLVQIEISGPEYRKYPVVSGHMPSEEEKTYGDKLVVVGKDIKKYTISQNGYDYITIQGEKYRVTGYLASDASGIFDYTILLFSDNLGDNFREALAVGLYSGNVLLYAGSDMSYGIDMFEDKLAELAACEEIYFQTMQLERFYASDVKTNTFKEYSALIYVFCIISIVFAVGLWVIERKVEIAIRKTYGETTINILWRIYRELFMMLLFAGIIAILLQLMIDFLSHEVMAYSIGKIWFMVRGLVVCTVATSAIAMFYPVFTTVRQEPVKLLSCKR